ncbi:O-antigen ligase family protein [Microbacterium sp. P02]|uniref:O-antigen ligase family protein n=1 Tax=Microbacterium sp. P02 TaxID=3366260 RepID=UPI00366C2A93
MSEAAPAAASGRWVVEGLASAELARAFTIASLGAVFSAVLIQRTAGRTTYITIIVALCVIGAAMLFARRREYSLIRLVPMTLVAFALWALVSVAWTSDRPSTLLGWVTLSGLALIAIVIAHVRDTLQTVRALGDVMRWLLSLSLILEIVSGVLIDTPLSFLGIQGNIAAFGPVQGIFGTRNLLGFATVIGLITFFVEYRTQSVRTGVAIFSVVLGGVLAAMSDSPTVFVLALAVVIAAGALTLVRRTRPEQRRALQWTLGVVVVVGVVAGYLMRSRIIAWIGAGSDFSTRSTLWATMSSYVRFKPVLGWGWFGPWDQNEFPFNTINSILGARHASALNAYMDVLLQLGWVGLLLFLAFCGVALVRSWLVASERRSIVYAWTPLILVALLVDSLFESFTLTGFGWVVLVLCALRAGQSRSWRDRIDAIAPGAEPPPIEGPLTSPR